jgi:hypothetical protein
MTQESHSKEDQSPRAQLSGPDANEQENAQKLRRIDGKYIVSEISRVIYLDKGILYTIKELLIRPGDAVHEFLRTDRNRIVKPVIFIIVASLVYSILRQLLHFEDNYINYGDAKQSTTLVLFTWISENYGYANLIMGLFIAFCTKLLFRKYDYNVFEILILLCFVMGMGMLVLAVFGALEGLFGFQALQLGGMVFIVYAAWAIGQFFKKKSILSFFKALAAYFLGMILFFLTVFLLGWFIDVIMPYAKND